MAISLYFLTRSVLNERKNIFANINGAAVFNFDRLGGTIGYCRTVPARPTDLNAVHTVLLS